MTFTHLAHLVNSYSSFKTQLGHHLSYHSGQPFQTWVPTVPLFLRITVPPNHLGVSLPTGQRLQLAHLCVPRSQPGAWATHS